MEICHNNYESMQEANPTILDWSDPSNFTFALVHTDEIPIHPPGEPRTGTKRTTSGTTAGLAATNNTCRTRHRYTWFIQQQTKPTD